MAGHWPTTPVSRHRYSKQLANAADARPHCCRDPRLELIHDDAYSRLRDYPGTFDVIIGDLNDPVDGGPCYQLYTDDFYKSVVTCKLNDGGVFVTQSGPCSMLSASMVFTSIHNTLRQCFPMVVPYNCHIPSFVDEWVRRSHVLRDDGISSLMDTAAT